MAFALWWVSVLLLVVAAVFFFLGKNGIAGITIRIATWLMILCIIGACIALLFGLF